MRHVGFAERTTTIVKPCTRKHSFRRAILGAEKILAKIPIIIKAGHLTTVESDIGFQYRERTPWGTTPLEVVIRPTLSATHSNRIRSEMDFSSTVASIGLHCLFILDKGKPIARSGRKAKGRFAHPLECESVARLPNGFFG